MAVDYPTQSHPRTKKKLTGKGFNQRKRQKRQRDQILSYMVQGSGGAVPGGCKAFVVLVAVTNFKLWCSEQEDVWK